MSIYLSHGLAAIIGLTVGYLLGRFLRSAVIEEVREKRNGQSGNWLDGGVRRKLMVGAVSGLMLLGLAGIVTTYVVIQRSERAIACDQEAILQGSRSTAAMLDELLRPDADQAARLRAVQAWRASQDETERRIQACK